MRVGCSLFTSMKQSIILILWVIRNMCKYIYMKVFQKVRSGPSCDKKKSETFKTFFVKYTQSFLHQLKHDASLKEQRANEYKHHCCAKSVINLLFVWVSTDAAIFFWIQYSVSKPLLLKDLLLLVSQEALPLGQSFSLSVNLPGIVIFFLCYLQSPTTRFE